MLISYIRIAFRNLLRHKGFSLISVLGLSLGMTVCLIIALYIQYQLSYDTHFEDYKNIYRVSYRKVDSTGVANLALTPVPLADKLSRQSSKLCVATKFIRGGNVLVSNERYQQNETAFFYADRQFFDVFSARFLMGNMREALALPYSVVLTRSTATRYFDDAMAVGKTLRVENGDVYTVTGIIEDYPTSSHFHFDFLASIGTLPLVDNDSWLTKNVYTYVKLFDRGNLARLEANIQELIHQFVSPQFFAATGETLQSYYAAGNELVYYFQPISRIYLWSDLDYEIETTGDGNYIFIFLFAGLGILLIVCFNFMNLATARFTNRHKEVGLKKTFGSSRSQLILQFMIETIFLCGISFCISLSLVELSLPVVNFLAVTELRFSSLFLIPHLVILFFFVLLVGGIAGSYPAVFLSSFNPIDIIKGHYKTAHKHLVFRKVLSIFQLFGLSSLFLCTIIIFQQLEFLSVEKFAEKNDRLIILPRSYVLEDRVEEFSQVLRDYPGISGVSITHDVPGEATSIIGFRLREDDPMKTHKLNILQTDDRFFDVYDIQLLQGRFFSQDDPENEIIPVLVNTAAIVSYGWEQPIGKELIYFDPMIEKERHYQIIGVVEDFHFESLHRPIQPALIKPVRNNARYISLKTDKDRLSEILAFAELNWTKFEPRRPFEYYFLESDLKRQYYPEQRVGQVFVGLTMVSILVTCAGLVGLVAFNIERRALELGIRKVVGASTVRIAWEIARGVLALFMIASSLAWPFSYFIMTKWLEQFAYHKSIALDAFVISGIITLAIVCLTICYHVFKIATRKPVELIYSN